MIERFLATMERIADALEFIADKLPAKAEIPPVTRVFELGPKPVEPEVRPIAKPDAFLDVGPDFVPHDSKSDMTMTPDHFVEILQPAKHLRLGKLHDAGIKTYGDLCNHTEADIAILPGVGAGMVTKLKAMLVERGLKFKEPGLPEVGGTTEQSLHDGVW